MAEYVHAMPAYDTRGRTGRDYVNPAARCGGPGRVALFADDVTCPDCLEQMAAQALRASLRTGIERAGRTVDTAVLDLSVWEGRGDWSALPAEHRTESARSGLEHLTEALGALEAERARLAEALGLGDNPETGLPWLPGDLVIDATGALYQRADEDQAAQGWPWGYAESRSGSVDEAHPRRPLTLLVRDGRPVGGVEIDAAAQAEAEAGEV